MKIPFILACLLLLSLFVQSQAIRNPVFIQGGLTANFLYKKSEPYAGPLGATETYDVENLKPLPGFILGITTHTKISNQVFFRFGGMMSYHVNSLTLDYTADVHTVGIVEQKENIKTRIRNLYLQLPVTLGVNFDERKRYYFFFGMNVAYRLANGSNWEYEHTTQNYDFSKNPPVFLYTTGPISDSEKITTHSSDIAIEIGFGQVLSNHLLLEERFYPSLTTTVYFGAVNAPTLHEATLEIILGWNLNKKE